MDDENNGGEAPCFAHVLVGKHPVDPDTARDVARFRRAERSRLVATRALSSEERARSTRALIEGLNRVLSPEPGLTIAVYWPIRGEPDLRGWMEDAHQAGARILLPVVTERHAPLEFHAWHPGVRMTRGHWNIMVPADRDPAVPDVVIAPLVGIDTELYRLGNGGGYYDRTLAEFDLRPRIIGVGFAGCLVRTIFPMPWDIPMTEAVLSDGTHLV
ncbi:5-formyltetrahydrofolate cyclo-ligase [Roseivivax sp. GX 12232]|uniref:5-formyltetrahydrofolate cyclo-ligase n=1 Tax=Roseivivax sp. GX 12232 TaxID=2900547 RepID=UPI001E30DE0A|nr:5-formyltetrahydrofolate cyclo-ligase [Roseivivax sp. GX 12232]MCE0507290.1 5-formyltetrahydrofolate cyclo-ligase [Roseivivax sp. GX 12232]